MAASVRDNFRINLTRLLEARLKLEATTQDAFALSVGISPVKLSRWKSGVFPRDPEDIDAIAKALDVPPGDLFKDPDERKAAMMDFLAELAKRAGYELKPRKN